MPYNTWTGRATGVWPLASQNRNGENKSKSALWLSFFAFAPPQRALYKPPLFAEVQRVWQPHAQPLQVNLATEQPRRVLSAVPVRRMLVWVDMFPFEVLVSVSEKEHNI